MQTLVCLATSKQSGESWHHPSQAQLKASKTRSGLLYPLSLFPSPGFLALAGSAAASAAARSFRQPGWREGPFSGALLQVQWSGWYRRGRYWQRTEGDGARRLNQEKVM